MRTTPKTEQRPASPFPACFRLKTGPVVATPGIADLIEQDISTWVEILHALTRHIKCDWGEVGREDWTANNHSVTNEARILSAYRVGPDRTKIWIITEADRSSTTILLPEEY